jgi:hypothetical protein
VNQKYIITIGYTKLVFESPETAMRAYALLTESTPITNAYVYGNEFKKPESLEGVEFVREADNVEIELKRVDSAKLALHLTEAEFKEKCRVRPSEVDGEARLLDVETPPAQIEAPPSNDVDATADEPF